MLAKKRVHVTVNKHIRHFNIEIHMLKSIIMLRGHVREYM